MNKHIPIFLLVFAMQLFVLCDLMGPKFSKGSITIMLTNDEQSGTTSIHMIEIIINHEGDLIYQTTLENTEGQLKFTIDNLNVGGGYSVNIYGRNTNSDIIAHASESNITISGEKQTSIHLIWSYNLTLTLSTTSIVLNADSGSTSTFDILSNTDWCIENHASWLAVSPVKGLGNSTINVTAINPDNAPNSRTDTVFVTGMGVEAQLIIVTQKSSNITLDVSATSLILNAISGSSSSFTISSNTRWSINDDASWLLIFPSNGSNGDTIKLTANSTNKATNSRTATVTVQGIDVDPKIVTVIQEGIETETMTDQDGNIYRTIKIADQWWMAENLKVTHYRNGDVIPRVTDNSEWASLSSDAYCAYENDENNASTYGYLYNWYAVNDTRNIAPEGWHAPTDKEWQELEILLGMNPSDANGTGYRGTDEGGKLKETNTVHWNFPNRGATDEIGFAALPGGYRYNSNGTFTSMTYYAGFWSASAWVSPNAWCRLLYDHRSEIYRENVDKRYGFSIRLVKD